MRQGLATKKVMPYEYIPLLLFVHISTLFVLKDVAVLAFAAQEAGKRFSVHLA